MKNILNYIADFSAWRDHVSDCQIDGEQPLAFDDFRSAKAHREAKDERAYWRAVEGIETDAMSFPAVPDRWTFSPGFMPGVTVMTSEGLRDWLSPRQEEEYLNYHGIPCDLLDADDPRYV